MFSVKTNVNEVLGFVDRLGSQYEFAVASALTNVVRDISKAMPAEVEKALDNPTPYTKAGFFFQRAEKTRLVAVVGVKDRQAQYLAYQVDGGTRQPTRQALRLPGRVQLNSFGNLPAGAIRQLVARAKAGKRVSPGQAKRFGVSKGLDLFYGEPGDGRPAGIYQRIVRGPDDHQLVPIVVFPKQAAKYEQRFDFRGIARRRVEQTFEPALRQAWARAKATAR